MARPRVFDLTHLQHRLAYDAPSGIDRVDLLYARHFTRPGANLAAAAHYGRFHLQALDPARLAELTARIEQRWGEDAPLETDEAFTRTRAWLSGEPVPSPAATPGKRSNLRWSYSTKLHPFVRYMHRRKRDAAIVPEGSLYLNIAQHSTEHPRFFAWLRRRPDVKAVFFIHDLLPLDHPEFWWAGHEALFRRRVNVMLEHASALITSGASVRARLEQEYGTRGIARVPILASPLPSALEPVAQSSSPVASDLGAVPYFVVLGTIEPRKNHLLLLNVWRRLAATVDRPPKLVLIGKRGWENQQTVALIDRSPGLRDHVWEVSGCSAATVTALVKNARALLMPSFAEGYGLPVVEALGLGTPVVASDLAVFREVSQGCAIFHDPTDGLQWSRTILELSKPGSEAAHQARQQAARFEPRTIAAYFGEVETFLATL